MEHQVNINKNFLVSFHGNFIPLQGVEYIIRAAKILEKYPDIEFEIIGDGQTRAEVQDLTAELKVINVRFIKRLPVKELPPHLRAADACLGIFGNTEKTQRVIPNKVYEAVAMAKPVITADTPAIRELFTDRENILLCDVADSEDLARKILELRGDLNLRSKIAANGHLLFEQKCLPKTICRNLLSDLRRAGII